MESELLDNIRQATLKGNYKSVPNLIKLAKQQNISQYDILNDGLAKGIIEASKKLMKKEIFYPEFFNALTIFSENLELLNVNTKNNTLETVVIGTARPNIHVIGKTVACALYLLANFEIIDLGVSVSANEFVNKAVGTNSKIICIAAYTFAALPTIAEVHKILKIKGRRKQLKIIAGGSAVDNSHYTQENEEIDAYVPNYKSLIPISTQLIMSDDK